MNVTILVLQSYTLPWPKITSNALFKIWWVICSTVLKTQPKLLAKTEEMNSNWLYLLFTVVFHKSDLFNTVQHSLISPDSDNWQSSGTGTEKGELLPVLKNKYLSPYLVNNPRDNCKVRVMQRHVKWDDCLLAEAVVIGAEQHCLKWPLGRTRKHLFQTTCEKQDLSEGSSFERQDTLVTLNKNELKWAA